MNQLPQNSRFKINWSLLRDVKYKSFLDLSANLEQAVNNLYDMVGEILPLQEELKGQEKKLCPLNAASTCTGCSRLKSVILDKDNVLQSLASTIIKLNESRDLNFIDEALKILSGDVNMLTPPKESIGKVKIKEELVPDGLTEREHSNMMNIKEAEAAVGTVFDAYVTDESINEINSTPTGRTSPIIGLKKNRSKFMSGWPDEPVSSINCGTPNAKIVKLSRPSPSQCKRVGKTKQTKLTLTRIKTRTLMDLSCSRDFGGGVRGSLSEQKCNPQIQNMRASTEDEDVILPSPTSEVVKQEFPIFRSFSSDVKCSPSKLFKKPLPLQRVSQDETKVSEEALRLAHVQLKQEPNTQADTDSQVSINLLRPYRFKASPKKSVLSVNNNVNNIPVEFDSDVSISLLHGQRKTERENMAPERTTAKLNNNRLNTGEPVHIYKEDVVRKRAEKKLLPGWSCDECKEYFGEKYKDNDEMLHKYMQECSKHRGRFNPAPPRTPPGFWDPRWTVPQDTEELNQFNNAL